MRISDWSSDVCSSDLFLACLPIEEVEVVMLTDLLDRGTGHIDAQPVLHLRVALQALGALNLHRAEPAALVDRLGGHMDWVRGDGFREIKEAEFGVDRRGRAWEREQGGQEE